MKKYRKCPALLCRCRIYPPWLDENSKRVCFTVFFVRRSSPLVASQDALSDQLARLVVVNWIPFFFRMHNQLWATFFGICSSTHCWSFLLVSFCRSNISKARFLCLNKRQTSNQWETRIILIIPVIKLIYNTPPNNKIKMKENERK